MMSWLNRFLIVVFLFYIVAPDLLQAQTVAQRRRQAAPPASSDAFAQTISRQVTARTEALQKSLEQAQTTEEFDRIYETQAAELAAQYDAIEVTDENPNYQKIFQIIAKRHQLEKLYGKNVAKFHPERNLLSLLYGYKLDGGPNPGTPEGEKKVTAKLLNDVKKADLDIIDLLETLDPFTPPINDTQFLGQCERIGYSAEIIYNTLLLLENRPEELKAVKQFLPHILERAMYSLQNLPEKRHDHENIIMARGSLRVLIAQVVIASKKAGVMKQVPASNKWKVLNGHYDHFEDFIYEILGMKNKAAANPGSREAQLLDLEIQYAVRYALQTEQIQRISSRIVSPLEEKPKWNKWQKRYPPTKFETEYLAQLTSLFSALTSFAQDPSVTTSALKKLFDVLVELSGPQHGTNVRILALGTAGELNRATSPSLQAYAKQVRAKDFQEEMQRAGTPLPPPPNIQPRDSKKPYPLSSAQSSRLVTYAVDLYHPLTNTFYGMETYGLSSKQMQALADTLAATIARLNNDLNSDMLNSPKEPVIIAAAGTEIKDRWPLRLKGSDGYVHIIEKHAPINTRKSDEEAGWFMAEFVVTWIAFDGVFALLGKFLKLIRGTTVVFVRSTSFGVKVTTHELSKSWRTARLVAKATEQSARAGETVAQATRVGRTATQTANVGRTAAQTARVGETATQAAQAGGKTLINPRAVSSAFGKGGRAFRLKWGESWRYMGTNFDRDLARRGLSITTQRAEQVTVKAAEMEGAQAGAGILGGGASATGGPASWTITGPVFRQGTSYVFGRTAQKGTQGFLRRTFNFLTGKTPQVESYFVSSARPGFQVTQAGFDAARMGLENGLNNPHSRKIFMRKLGQYAQQTAGGPNPFQIGRLSAEELGQINFERQFMQTLGPSLGGLHNGSFDFWSYNGRTFEMVTPEEFADRLRFIGQDATRAAQAASELPNYFEILGLERTATKEEIKAAYQRLGKVWHPNVYTHEVIEAEERLAKATTDAERAAAQAELDAANAHIQEATAKFNQIKEAYDLLYGGKTIKVTLDGAERALTRADYEQLLDKILQATDAGHQGLFPLAFPQAPNGFQLAVSPKGGTNLNPDVISAMDAPGFPAGGFGIGPDQVLNGDLTQQFAAHLFQTGQIPELGGLLIRNDPGFQFLKNIFVGGGEWYALDVLHAPARDEGINAAYLAQYQQELAKYGDMFQPVPQTNSLANAVPQTPSFSEQLQNVQAQKGDLNDKWGATFSLLYTVPRMRNGKIDLIPESTRTMLTIQAKRVELNNAIVEQHTTGALNQAINQMATELRLTREEYNNQIEQEPAFAPYYQDLLTALADYETQMTQLANSNDDFTVRTERYNQIMDGINALEQDLLETSFRAVAERSIRQLQQTKELTPLDLLTSPYQKYQLLTLYDEVIAMLEKASRAKTIEEYTEWFDKAEAHLTTREQQIRKPTEVRDVASMTDAQKEQMLREDWDQAQFELKSYEEYFNFYGNEGVKVFNAVVANYKKQIDALLRNKQLPIEEKQQQYYDLTNQLLDDLGNKLAECQNKAAQMQ